MIRKIITLCIALLSTVMLFGQKPVNITGTANISQVKKITLYQILNGRLKEMATSNLDDKGRFGFRFTPIYEGFYVIGIGNPSIQMGLHRFYFKGDENLNVILSANGYELVAQNSPENEALFAWDKEIKTIHDKAVSLGGNSTYVDFFPEIESFKGKLESVKKRVQTPNKAFNALFPKMVDYDFAYYGITYMFMPKSVHPSKEEMTDFYMDFNADKYLTTELLKLPYGDRFLNNLVYKKVDLSTRPTFDQQVMSIPEDVLKGQYVIQQLERSRSYNEYEELMSKYGKYLTLEEQKSRATTVETKLVDTKEGGTAFQFKFPDATGKMVSLSDLKGKVVLIDMWATWCGPCRAEEPYWEKLNDEFKDKAVAFVGISTDQDKAKWLSYYNEKKLKGIQLHAGVGNPLSIAYQVNTIPRYILIDKKGNLITANSPRPSDPKLKELIESWLLK